VRAVARELRRLAADLGTDDARVVITDTGSTKRSVVAAAQAAGLAPRFVGSHPIAGDHRSGWGAARKGLFDGEPVWVCPAPSATAESVRRIESLWLAVGANPHHIDPAVHDRLLARTSHLPQVVATAVGLTLAEADMAPDALGPGGRDVTRLAGSDPAIWADILLDNADEMGPVLEAFGDILDRMREAIEAGDTDAVRSLLTAASAWSYGSGVGRSTPRMRGEVGGKNASSR
jgi:prephenate dehydrogenase